MTKLQELRMENAELVSTLRRIHRLAGAAIDTDDDGLEDEELENDDDQDDEPDDDEDDEE